MRNAALRPLYAAVVLACSLTSTAIQIPELRPFTSALIPSLNFFPSSEANETAHEELKRQNSYSNSCPDDFDSCVNLGASNLCCNSDSVCSADYAGNVACCPSGVACSGVVTGVITAGTLSDGSLIGGGLATAGANTESTTDFVEASATSDGLVQASTVPTGYNTDSSGQTTGFIFDGASTVATPAAAVRNAELPLVVAGLIRLLQYLPI